MFHTVVATTVLGFLLSFTAPGAAGTSGGSGDAVRFTSSSMDFYGYIEGAQPGDKLTVYDERDVLCGSFTVVRNGQYGFVPVYGDDKATPIDEGADVNSPLTFRLNGIPLLPLSGQDIIWLGDGQRMQVDFRR